MNTRWEGDYLQTKETGLLEKKKNLLPPWPWNSSQQSYERINFSCLRNPVIGILLWQLKLTNAVRIVDIAEGEAKGWNQGGP